VKRVGARILSLDLSRLRVGNVEQVREIVSVVLFIAQDLLDDGVRGVPKWRIISW
jgi:hypothetical protein